VGDPIPVPDEVGPPPVGIRTRGGETCYLCDAFLREGDEVVRYFDETFWKHHYLYHAACWQNAALAAKAEHAQSAVVGVVMVMPDTECAACHGAIHVGDRIVRQAAGTAQTVGGERHGPQVFHADCHPQAAS